MVQGLPDITLWPGETLQLADLDDVFSDPNGTPLTYVVDLNNAKIATNSTLLTSDHILELLAATDVTAGSTAVITATDASGKQATDNFVISVPTRPAVTTGAVTGITQTTASGGGNVTSTGSTSVFARGLCWNTTGSPTTDDAKSVIDSGGGSFSSGVIHLNAGTLYYLRAYAANSAGTSYGNEVTFTTPAEPTIPVLTTVTPTSITFATATSGGTISSNGGAAITAKGVCWSTSQNPTVSLSTKTTDGSGSASFTSNITGLAASTTYYLRSYATNPVGTGYGSQLTFSTTTAAVPALSTAATTSIGTTTATSGGAITSDGGAAVTARGVCWSVSPNPTISLTTKTSNGSGSGAFTSNVTGLNPSTVYHVRAYATNTAGTQYGQDVIFTTLSLGAGASVTTTNASSIGNTFATSGGNITSDGGSTVTARGVVWNTTSTLSVTMSTKTVDGSGTGAFTSNITGLQPGTLYYLAAYATNSITTSYGATIQITTLANATVPSVTTTPISNVTATSLTCGGNISSTGGAAVTARGVCWSTSVSPTVALATKTSDGTGDGGFISNPGGLSPGTTYYVRAYATNSVGTAYGSELIVQTSPNCPAISAFPHVQGFNGASLPSCWSNVNVNGVATQIWMFGSFGDGVNGTTPPYAYLNSDGYGSNNHQDADLISPSFDFSAVTQASITFKHYFRAYANSSGTFSISTDGGASWESLQSWAQTTVNPGTASYNISQKVSGQGNVRFKWNYTGTYGWYWSVDDIQVNNYEITGPAIPILTTKTVTAVTYTTATSGGTISSEQGSPVTSRGICWSTDPQPTISLSTKTSNGTGIGEFTSGMTDLQASELYYVRAYATNAIGTAYGAEVQFQTLAAEELLPPLVSTEVVTAVTSSGAKSGGTIIGRGMGVTLRGVVFGTNANPTIALPTKTSNGSGAGTYTSVISGLIPGTSYHLRAYASYAGGVSYGEDLTFTTAKVQQTIAFSKVNDVVIGSPPFNLNATSSAALPVAFSTTSDKITISGNMITTVKPGRVPVTARQAGTAQVAPADSVRQTFCVLPRKPEIILTGESTATPLLTSSSSVGNSWFLNGVGLPAKEQALSVTQPGVYKVRVTIDDCVSEYSAETNILITGIVEANDAKISIVPNPVHDEFTLLGLSHPSTQAEAFDVTGKIHRIQLARDGEVFRGNATGLAAGFYWLRIASGKTIQQVKLIKD